MEMRAGYLRQRSVLTNCGGDAALQPKATRATAQSPSL